MRFEVPQFIDVEDKIFGDFTWKQFVYLAGGGGAALVLFFMLPFYLFVILAIPIVALAAGLAFHKVNNRPFSIFLESFVQYTLNKKLYLWRRKNPQEITQQGGYRQTGGVQPTYTPPTERSHISSLSRKLELDTLDVAE